MSKRMYDRTTFVAAMIGVVMLLAIMDASCAIDPKSIGCNVTNGKTMSIVFPRLQAMEAAFWRSLPG